MGASGWDYYTGYDEDLDEVLNIVQTRVLAAEQYYWGDEEIERPSTVAELRKLLNDDDYEDLAAEGTHSILDIYQVQPAGSPDQFGTVIVLSDAEVVDAFGTSKPTRAEFYAVYRGGENLITDSFSPW